MNFSVTASAHQPVQAVNLVRIDQRLRKEIGIIPGSYMDAMEAALWALLGQRRVDVLDFDGLGHFWAVDVVEQLKVAGSRVLKVQPGEIVSV